jgi:PTS system D-glucosamine-specific IIC component
LYFALYFFLFRFLITRRNYATPGREDDLSETKLYTRADYNKKKAGEEAKESESADKSADDGKSKMDQSEMIVEGLGGRENIANLDCCATRLRVTVHDSALVSEEMLKQSGAAGVIRKGNGVQVIYGPQVAVIKSELEEFLR